jgi:hypothetical protein
MIFSVTYYMELRNTIILSYISFFTNKDQTGCLDNINSNTNYKKI